LAKATKGDTRDIVEGFMPIHLAPFSVLVIGIRPDSSYRLGGK
jgi:hypothetical protein